ncbi:MAG: hypothetical protein ACXVB4_07285 [Pseudobdellovibrionaceae bacterium]
MADSTADPIESVFITAFKRAVSWESLNAEAQAFIEALSKQQKQDFASIGGGYFSSESQEFIAKEAASILAKSISEMKLSEIGRETLQVEWQKIVTDFYQHQYWGQVPQLKKPAKVLTEEQKRTRELASYIWAAFQAWIVMKLVIFYFGLEAADEPQETHWWLYLAILFSFGSLIFFAWRKIRKGD